MLIRSGVASYFEMPEEALGSFVKQPNGDEIDNIHENIAFLINL
jgi:hypothetical protein